MPSNELTILRFYGDQNGEIPPVSPRDLSTLCEHLRAVFRSAAHAAIKIQADVTWTFAVPPRRGCLEVVLNHHVTIVEAAQATMGGGDLLNVADLLLQAVFGGRGLIDLFVRKQPTPPIDDTQSNLYIAVVDQSLNDAGVRDALSELLGSAAALAAKRITIQISDSEPVPLLGADVEHDASPLLRVAGRGPEDQAVQRVTGLTKPVAKGELRGRNAQIFLGEVMDDRQNTTPVVVVWLSGEAPPGPHQTKDVRGGFATAATLAELKLLSPIPKGVEKDAKGVVVVYEAVAVWR